jgi:uncharacterized protein
LFNPFMSLTPGAGVDSVNLVWFPVLDRCILRRGGALSIHENYGPWAVVTGASDGIGQEFARVLAEEGVNLVLVARRENALRDLAVSLSARAGIDTLIFPSDLSERASIGKLLDQLGEKDIGLVVAAAGFGTSGCFATSEPRSELAMIDVNCRSVVELVRAFCPRLIQRGRGGIVLMSSLLAFQGVPRSTNYAATRAFVQTFAEGLAVELRPLGIDVVSCAPGPIASGFAARANMKMSMSQRPEAVARETLKALGRRVTVRPGWLSKFLELSLAFLPRLGRVRIMGVIMYRMTKHQNVKTTDQNPKPA